MGTVRSITLPGMFLWSLLVLAVGWCEVPLFPQLQSQDITKPRVVVVDHFHVWDQPNTGAVTKNQEPQINFQSPNFSIRMLDNTYLGMTADFGQSVSANPLKRTLKLNHGLSKMVASQWLPLFKTVAEDDKLDIHQKKKWFTIAFDVLESFNNYGKPKDDVQELLNILSESNRSNILYEKLKLITRNKSTRGKSNDQASIYSLPASSLIRKRTKHFRKWIKQKKEPSEEDKYLESSENESKSDTESNDDETIEDEDDDYTEESEENDYDDAPSGNENVSYDITLEGFEENDSENMDSENNESENNESENNESENNESENNESDSDDNGRSDYGMSESYESDYESDSEYSYDSDSGADYATDFDIMGANKAQNAFRTATVKKEIPDYFLQEYKQQPNVGWNQVSPYIKNLTAEFKEFNITNIAGFPAKILVDEDDNEEGWTHVDLNTEI